MPGLVALVAAQQGRAQDVEVADGVQRLVPHELAFHPQAAGVQDLVAVDDDRILEAPAARQSGLTQGLDLMREAEGAGRHDLGAEGLLIDDEIDDLMADDRVVEIDLEPHLVTVARQQGRVLVAVGDVDGLQNLDVADRRLLTAEAGAVQQLDERQGRTVEDRQLGPVDLDHDVGDAERAEGRHQMLDRRQAHPRRILDHGVQPGIDDGVARDDDAVVAVRDVGTDEDDAGSGRGRADGQAHALARVHAHAGADRRGDQGPFTMIVACGQGVLLDRRPAPVCSAISEDRCLAVRSETINQSRVSECYGWWRRQSAVA